MKNQIAVITGAAQGIGMAVARELIGSGTQVISWDIDKTNVSAMADLGKNALAIECDITDLRSVQSAYAVTCKQVGIPTILVNSAGIAGPNEPLDTYDVEAWHRVIDINLHGAFYVNRVCVEGMKKTGYGRILNIASIAGKEGNPNASAYSASKAAVIGMTKSLGKELADKNIAVNAVTPAGAKTRILDQMSKEHVQKMLSKVPRGRFLEIHEFTSLICWLSSEENTFSTAAVFDISGGRSTY